MRDLPKHPQSSPRTKGGFTLIELLVVMMIIAVLLGLLFPSISFVQNIARKNKARALLSQIQGALNVYKDSQGTYPDKIVVRASSLPASYDPPGGANPYDLNTDYASGGPNDSAYTLITALRLVDSDTFRETDSTKTLKQIIDPWGGIVRYRPARYYPFGVGASTSPPPGHIDSATPPNPQSYQLWSIGPNMTDDCAGTPSQLYGDDIVVWSK